MRTIVSVFKMAGLTIGGIVILLIVTGFLFLILSPEFGGKITDLQKETFRTSSNFKEGQFINQIPTPMTMDFGTIKTLIRDYAKGNPHGRPTFSLPVKKVDSSFIANSSSEAIRITWFGHSAFLLEIEALNILIDPMFGDVPAPHPWLGGKRFNPELPIQPESLPAIDLVIFSHDHYDHLDYSSVVKLKDKVKKFYVPLGVGTHLRAWGVNEEKIEELNWGDSVSYKGINLICAPARHFSGRGLFDRDATLWSSWIIESSNQNLYFSGDSGYGPHFKSIGQKYGPFDFAMLECGQYDERWKNIHMMPEETVKAAQDLNVKLMMPIHWGAFKLSLHDWNDPVKRASLEAQRLGIPFVTPQIGETILLNGAPVVTDSWWK